MIEKIFKIFFKEIKQTKKTTPITVVRESSLFNEKNIISRRVLKEQNENLTCLSGYFKNIKGLNLAERQRVSLAHIHK